MVKQFKNINKKGTENISIKADLFLLEFFKNGRNKMFAVVSIEENGKNYAYAMSVSDQDNLLKKFKIKGIKKAVVCGTRKRAKEFVTMWNTLYKENGTYLYDEPLF